MVFCRNMDVFYVFAESGVQMQKMQKCTSKCRNMQKHACFTGSKGAKHIIFAWKSFFHTRKQLSRRLRFEGFFFFIPTFQRFCVGKISFVSHKVFEARFCRNDAEKKKLGPKMQKHPPHRAENAERTQKHPSSICRNKVSAFGFKMRKCAVA